MWRFSEACGPLRDVNEIPSIVLKRFNVQGEGMRIKNVHARSMAEFSMRWFAVGRAVFDHSTSQGTAQIP